MNKEEKRRLEVCDACPTGENVGGLCIANATNAALNCKMPKRCPRGHFPAMSEPHGFADLVKATKSEKPDVEVAEESSKKGGPKKADL